MSATYFPSDEIVSRYRGRRALGGYLRLARPFTLLAPALGMASGGIVAYFADGAKPLHGADFLRVLLLGTIAAALLNAASNALNQIFDLDIDRINKPGRPLCTGDVSALGAGIFAAITLALALVLATVVSTLTRNWATLALFAAASAFSVAYSVPPLRMKARGWWANLTVALPRGTLLKVAGWSLAQSVLSIEAWFIGLVMGLFLVGATTTKDFADVRGDAAYGVKTLPVMYGPAKAAKLVAPFIVLPFLLLPLGALTGVLTGHLVDLVMLGAICALWGAHIAARIMGDPESLTTTENHPAWRHMYYLMLFIQVGFVFAYVPYDFYGSLIRKLS
ncbi:MAG: UbiA family prenyltransferase [Planctomycetes bacterium]|nr:UbiA family prenyltransferase [Planctomycetota bacterium]MCB9936390.1 UbiA family prenyltransferase [Planctomycetota bacterium]